MFTSLKRWLSGTAGDPGGPAFAALADWAQRSGFVFRQAKDATRLVVEASSAGAPVRMEWGPSQRSYIEPDELRVRIDLNLPGSMQMLVLNRALLERLESETFERYTQDAQTVIDMSTPEEMRWLAMFPKTDLSSEKALRQRVCVLGGDPESTLAWIKGPIGAVLERAYAEWLAPEVPFVLMVMRGKVYLRMQVAMPSPELLSRCLEVFDAAVQSALQISGQFPAADADWASTASTAWQTQAALDDERADPSRL